MLFHDLKPLQSGTNYAIWPVTTDGKWVHGPSFTPDGYALQKVDLDLQVAEFDRCAVTLETQTGRGLIVMQSRIAPAR